MRFLAFLLICCTAASMARAQDNTANLVKAELLADTTAVVPGTPFTVGVKLTVAPEWHVYWINPGDAGLPIRVKWNLPDGYSAGELQFPTPIKFVQPGDIVGYGYEREVMVTAQITPPSNASLSLPAAVSANVAWLVCKDVCIPGKKSLSVELPVASDAKPANAELFKTWIDRMPVVNLSTAIKGVVDGLSSDNRVQRFDILWKGDANGVEFFPPPADDITFSDIQVQQDGRKTTLSFRAETLDKKVADVSKLTGVLAYVNQDGQRRGVVLPLGHQP